MAETAQPGGAPENGPQPRSDRDRIIAAFFGVLGEKAFEEVELGEIATRAVVSLSTLRSEFDSKLAIVAARMRDLDRKVLEGGDADLAQEPPRERLFDVLMRRLEALAPDRPALRSLMRSARRNPALAFALNGLAVRSTRWMLTAANIPVAGPRGMMRSQGLALLFADVLRTFVNDDDEGLSRTMAALDRALSRGERALSLLNGLCRLLPRRGSLPGRHCRRHQERRDTGDGAGEEAMPL